VNGKTKQFTARAVASTNCPWPNDFDFIGSEKRVNRARDFFAFGCPAPAMQGAETAAKFA
jgi:hypothetical protein